MQNPGNLALLDIYIRFPFANPLEPELVGFLVTLCARCPDGRTSLGVEHPKLQAGHVGGFAHLAPQRVNLPRQMALGQTTDGRVA